MNVEVLPRQEAFGLPERRQECVIKHMFLCTAGKKRMVPKNEKPRTPFQTPGCAVQIESKEQQYAA